MMAVLLFVVMTFHSLIFSLLSYFEYTSFLFHLHLSLAQGNVFSANFGSKVAFLANICNCKLRIFSPPHNRGVHVLSSDRSRTPLRDCFEHQNLLMISHKIIHPTPLSHSNFLMLICLIVSNVLF